MFPEELEQIANTEREAQAISDGYLVPTPSGE